MKFYHSTTKDNAESIIKSQEIYPSKFNTNLYLKQYLENGWFEKEDFKESDYRLPYSYDDNGVPQKLYWLGHGVYCFIESDFKEAKEYNKKLDKIIEVFVNLKRNNEHNIFNMDSKVHRNLLREFIDVGLKQLEDAQPNDILKKHASNLRTQLKHCLHNNFKGTPHAAGVLIDLFTKVHPNYKIVKCTFNFGGGKKNPLPWLAHYVAIKDPTIIYFLKEHGDNKPHTYIRQLYYLGKEKLNKS